MLSVSENESARLVDIDEFNLAGKTMRSILFFDENKNVFVGQNAVNEYIKNGANGRLMQSIKTSLPHKNFTHTNIFVKEYAIEDLVSIILRHIKQTGEKYIGHEVSDVFMGRPAVFSDSVAYGLGLSGYFFNPCHCQGALRLHFIAFLVFNGKINIMDISEKQTQKIIELAEKFNLKLILLFGSYASGHANRDSDVDLAYFSSRKLSFEEEILINTEFCNILQTDRIDTVNLKTAHPLLLNQILENNKIIYEESPVYYSIFEASTLQKYKEAEPLFEMRSEHLKKFVGSL